MARASKPIALTTGARTKEEIQAREEAEKRFKGEDDLVYQCPSDLITPREKQLYMFLVNQLKNSGILNNLDIEILKSTVFCIIQMNEANDNIRKNGTVVIDDNGKMYKNPATTVYKDYHAMFITNSIRIGLTPSDRSKLAILDVQNKEKEEDPLLKILGTQE